MDCTIQTVTGQQEDSRYELDKESCRYNFNKASSKERCLEIGKSVELRVLGIEETRRYVIRAGIFDPCFELQDAKHWQAAGHTLTAKIARHLSSQR